MRRTRSTLTLVALGAAATLVALPGAVGATEHHALVPEYQDAFAPKPKDETPIVSTGVALLHAPHVGATNPGFTPGSCPSGGANTWGWHFVLPDNTSGFTSIEVTFAKAGTVTTFVSHPSGKHAYVFTATADTLLGASATVSGPATRFNLSHVCPGTLDHPTEDPTEDPTEETVPVNPPAPPVDVPAPPAPPVDVPAVRVLGAVEVAAPAVLAQPVLAQPALAQHAVAEQPPVLAFTGADPLPELLAGLSLLGGGIVTTAASRRRLAMR
jgi:hypothetical protein